MAWAGLHEHRGSIPGIFIFSKAPITFQVLNKYHIQCKLAAISQGWNGQEVVWPTHLQHVRTHKEVEPYVQSPIRLHDALRYTLLTLLVSYLYKLSCCVAYCFALLPTVCVSYPALLRIPTHEVPAYLHHCLGAVRLGFWGLTDTNVQTVNHTPTKFQNTKRFWNLCNNGYRAGEYRERKGIIVGTRG